MTELPIQQVLLDSIAAIERLGIAYAVMGGFAARAWGLPRPTFDADIVVVVDGDELQRLFAGFESAGFDVPAEHKTGFLDAVGPFQKARVTRFFGGHAWTTDLFLANHPLLTSAMARARSAMIGDYPARVLAPEDIILLKLIASRRKDLADVEEIISICRELDIGYLRAWAERLGVAVRLDEFLPP